MKRKGQVNALGVILSFVFLLGILGVLFTAKSQFYSFNNVTSSGNYQETEDEINTIVDQLSIDLNNDFDTSAGLDVNVSGGSITNEESTFEKALKYTGTITGFVPTILGLTGTILSDLGLGAFGPFVLGILVLMVISTVTYVMVVFLRRGF